MAIFAVRYTYDQRADVRDAVRPEHRDYLRGLADAGSLHGSGPFADGEPGALLVLDAPDRAALDALLAADPFAREGLIGRTDVREWSLLIGPWAAAG